MREPLKTLISREDPSTTFAVLSHVLLLLQRAPFVFQNVSVVGHLFHWLASEYPPLLLPQEYQSFYCRMHDDGEDSGYAAEWR